MSGYNAEQGREMYNWYKKHGICVACRTNDAVGNMTMCGDCLFKMNQRCREWRSKNNDYSSAYSKKRNKRLKEAGICVECGREKARPGRVNCESCALKRRVRAASKRILKVKPDGICFRCDQPAMEGKKCCEKHYAINVQNMLNARRFYNPSVSSFAKLNDDDVKRILRNGQASRRPV